MFTAAVLVFILTMGLHKAAAHAPTPASPPSRPARCAGAARWPTDGRRRGRTRAGERTDGRAPGESDESASDWIAKWKARKEERSAQTPEQQEYEYQQRRQKMREASFVGYQYAYVYCHGFRSSPDSAKAGALARLLASRGIGLTVPDLRGPATPSCAGTSVRHMLDAIGEAVAAAKAEANATKVRIVGSSLGGYAAALYAAQNPDDVDSLVLLCPALEPKAVLGAAAGGDAAVDAWRSTGSHDFGDGDAVNAEPLLGELDELPGFPLVRCPVLVVHGTRDSVVPLESSLAFTRMASINMRPLGMSDEEVEERRLLEVDDEHDLAASMEYILERLCTYFDIETTGEMAMRQGLGVDLEGARYGSREDYARSHGYNFETIENFEEWSEEAKRAVREREL